MLKNILKGDWDFEEFYMNLERNRRLLKQKESIRLEFKESRAALPATFCIYRDRVEVVNANNPHGEGQLSIKNFTPYAKNPTISKFFMQLGRVEECPCNY
jgi:hypothetical protein